MIAFLNGEYLPEAEARVSVLDRGYLYGDGLFETIPVSNGRPFRWAQHLERLRKGADWLGIPLPFSPKEVRGVIRELVRRNELPHSTVRVALSRGVGPRGYSPAGAGAPSFSVTHHSAAEIDPDNPPRWNLCTASVRVPAGDRLVQFKTASRLMNIVARAEAEAAGAQEALIVNTNGEITEASGGNLFWVWRGTIHTSPTSVGALPGITRAVILELCATLGIPNHKKIIRPDMLCNAEGVFLTQSTEGVIAVEALDETRFEVPPLIQTLSKAYWELVKKESA